MFNENELVEKCKECAKNLQEEIKIRKIKKNSNESNHLNLGEAAQG